MAHCRKSLRFTARTARPAAPTYSLRLPDHWSASPLLGLVNRCVIVSFSAQAYAPAGRLIWVRALLDRRASIDGEIAFAAEDGNFAQAHSYSFLFPSVAPGAHQVFLEYRSQVNGEAVNIDRFAVEVQHR